MSEEEIIRSKILSLGRMENYAGPDRVISIHEFLNDNSRPNSFSVNTKIPKLDELTEGFREGQLIVFSGPTGGGKTSILQNLTGNFTDDGVPCLWFSFEVPVSELAKRFNDKVPTFYLPRQIREPSLIWLKNRCLEGIAKYHAKVIFIDHLHYLLDMKVLAQTRNTSLVIGVLMRELKKFAINTDTIIFLVSHLTKTKLDEAPTLEDLRDSSFIAQESDFVIMIWRHRERDLLSPSGYNFTDESWLSVTKNRWNGKLGSLKMSFKDGIFKEIDGKYDLGK